MSNKNKIKSFLKFSTYSGNEYVFDNIKSLVFPCNNIDYYIINNFFDLNKNMIVENLIQKNGLHYEEIIHRYNYIDKLIAQGHFYKEDCLSKKFEKFDEKMLYNIASSQLILIVTEDCNIRCKYCVYSEQYPNIKGYTNKKMEFKIARKAIDYYAKLHTEREEHGYRGTPIISFYGGEPFLEFDLICKIIEYANTKIKNLSYHLTTNATILTDDIINFIIKYRIHITFSLDGNKENHDRNRVFPGNKGTFDLIYGNILKLQDRKKKLGVLQPIVFNCCYDKYTNFSKIVNFFNENDEAFSPYNLMFNEVYKYETLYYDNYDNIFSNQKKESIQSFKYLKEKYINNLIKNRICSKPLSSFFSSLGFFAQRSTNTDINSTCLPSSKIAVAPDGNMYICEKMCQSYPIGHVDSGLDINKISNIIHEFYDITEKKCKDCNISTLCGLCYTFLIKDNKLKFNPKFCEDTRASTCQTLSILYTILEKNPDAYDNISNHMKKIFLEVKNETKEGV